MNSIGLFRALWFTKKEEKKGKKISLVKMRIVNGNGLRNLLNRGFNHKCYKPMFTFKFTISLHDGNKMLERFHNVCGITAALNQMLIFAQYDKSKLLRPDKSVC